MTVCHCSNEYQELSNRLSVEDGLPDVEEKKGLDHPSYTSEERVNNVTVSVYSNEYQELSNRLSVEDGLPDVEEKKGLDHPSYTSEERVNNVTVSVCSNEYQELSNRLSVEDGLPDVEEIKGLDHPSYTSEERVNNVTVIKMDIRDPDITKTGTLLFVNKNAVILKNCHWGRHCHSNEPAQKRRLYSLQMWTL